MANEEPLFHEVARMRLNLCLYEAPLPPRSPWDREASLVFLLAEDQEAPLVLYAEAYGERAMGEVRRALGLPSDYDPAVDGAPGMGFYESGKRAGGFCPKSFTPSTGRPSRRGACFRSPRRGSGCASPFQGD